MSDEYNVCVSNQDGAQAENARANVNAQLQGGGVIGGAAVGLASMLETDRARLAAAAGMAYGTKGPLPSNSISATVRVPATRDFSDALRALKDGQRITRAGWNGQGMFVVLQRPDKNSKMTEPYPYLEKPNGTRVPWLASIGDLLASDWAILPHNASH